MLMFRQGPDFHFEISGKRVRDNESQLYMFFCVHSHMPKIYQAFLMSATLGDDVKTLKKLILHNAVS